MSLISVTPKFDAFVKFCSEQDPETKINHFTYDTCAISEFAPTYNEMYPEDPKSPTGVVYQMLDELAVVNPELSDNFGDKLGYALGDTSIDTYGGLSQWLNQLHHKVTEAAQ